LKHFFISARLSVSTSPKTLWSISAITTFTVHLFSMRYPSYLAAFWLAALTLPPIAYARSLGVSNGASSMVRTVITTDMEQDDLTSMLRYLLYSSEIDTQGLIYSASKIHWAGDGKQTRFFLPGRAYDTPQTSWRWTGNSTIENDVIKPYKEVYNNLLAHDARFPTPEKLLSITKLGNVMFEGEYEHDTAGSDLIRSLILDKDPRTLYLQVWGGTNTVARALKSIEEQFSGLHGWEGLKTRISRKVVIMSSFFQDDTYVEYIAPSWPDIQVRSVFIPWTLFNCETGNGNVRGLPADRAYFTGDWIQKNIQIGPYGSKYRSWLDGQHMPGDPWDVFGNTTAAPIVPGTPASDWCKPLGSHDFLSEGDNGAYLPLLATGLNDPKDPNKGGWGGRFQRNESSAANLLASIIPETSPNGKIVDGYGTLRFVSDIQNDLAARIQWTMTSNYSQANHPPMVRLAGPKVIQGRPGSSVILASIVSDPDHHAVATKWWQYIEEGTYNGSVPISRCGPDKAKINIPADAVRGETISIILQGTDSGKFPLTRYDRSTIIVS
jgi:hypothetical protein